MFAVVVIAGKQFEVEPQKIVKVPRLEGNPGDSVCFDKVLLTESATDLKIGAPFTNDVVEAKILEHGKDAKVIVFKKKRRKGYRKLNKHRQHFTRIEITAIEGGSAAPRAKVKPAAKETTTATKSIDDILNFD